MSKIIRVVVKKPGQIPTVENVDGHYRSLQKIVEGPIETAMKWNSSVGQSVAYCDEEYLLREERRAMNVVRPSDGHPIFGTLVVVGIDSIGDDRDLTDDEVACWASLLAVFSPEMSDWIDDPQIEPHVAKFRNDCTPNDWTAIEKMLARQTLIALGIQ